MEELYATYKDKIEFLIVYIREAHPEMLRKGNATGIEGRPANLDERIILATECVTRFKLSIPMVIDGMEGKVNKDYQAHPVRTTITDVGGKVVYYAGPGPFDFNLNKVEKVLNRLVEGEGRLPPRPEPKWGSGTKGVYCGLSLDSAEAVLDQEVTVVLSIKNRSGAAVDLAVDSDAVLENLSLKNRKGQTLRIEAAPDDSFMGRMKGRFGLRPRHIADGEVFTQDIFGILRASAGSEQRPTGRFKATAHVSVKDRGSSGMRRRSRDRESMNLWTGELTSGDFVLDVSVPPPMGCADCHGEGNYHHVFERDCSLCHTGVPETETFAQDFASCAQCHPRGEERGRRQILGEGGEFTLASVHRPGKVRNEDCLICHDSGQHTMGVVRLLDPRTGKPSAWTGAEPEFCLSCHNANPPAGFTFPEAKGSGYDKSDYFIASTPGRGKKCTECHATHGSSHPALTLEEGIESPHR